MEKSTSDDQENQQNLETGSSVTNGNQHRDDQLINSIKKMAESLEPPLSSNECCIYRIPTWLRKVNEEAYTPLVISIGPFHHGSKRLETMEKLKLKYFKKFWQRIDFKDVKMLVNEIKLHEERVRSCYAETIKFSSDDFVKLILVDGIFIIELFYRICGGFGESYDAIIADNHILLDVVSREAMLLDIQLLENQLPLFILDIIFSIAYAVPGVQSFTSLAIEAFERLIRNQDLPGDLEVKPRHFVDLNEVFFVGSSRKQLSQHESNDLASANPLHPKQTGVKSMVRSCKCLLDLTRHFVDHFTRAFSLPTYRKLLSPQVSRANHLYTASQLYEAGVKFKVMSPSKYLFDLKFTNGTLEIPCMIMNDQMEPIYRNIIAFEQCRYPRDAKFIDYIVVLNFLIKTPEDVDLLIRKGIIINWLPNSKALSSCLTNLFTNVMYLADESVYCDLVKDLNAFCENTKNTWKATMKRDYFDTPWKIASTAAAIALLLLTLIQTICSIIQIMKT